MFNLKEFGQQPDYHWQKLQVVIGSELTPGVLHKGFSDKGNYNSSGSKGCPTISPDDWSEFTKNFDWSGTYQNIEGNTGNSEGTVIINRNGNNSDNPELKKMENLQQFQNRNDTPETFTGTGTVPMA